ncbi:hypothetical protein AWC05_21390 [Mycobacterium florentinum]|uniref:Secreted protein n=1 Tax=Mycobacterium florentinum TaxID=292462 RepID=A0A1X1U5K7_MYCFL|nr:DUF6636 domain-containing protein [Mycobacterium florentinum]MCV7410306.1 hypothetical protein [Mycobacterium florentinum]ORV52097.1 hypothetical protein AWC05_21390 [Mycobacterium florentinum]BBX79621.1 hypothetical protein MFLOJ_34080 [Mycobacterium florentinum]
MKRAVVAGIGFVVVGCCAGMPVAAADNPACTPSMCAFLSPSRNISCEVNYKRDPGIPDEAYCQTNEPQQSVHLSTGGVVTTCKGVSCVGNAGEGAPTLDYGQTAGVGPFTCTSKPDGVTCTASSGKGFTISNAGITSIG